MSEQILSTLYSRIELHIGADPEFTRLFGAKVKATPGGRYSECRGYSGTRYVHLHILTEEGLKLASSILSRFPASLIIMRMPNVSHDGMRLIDGYPTRHLGSPGDAFQVGSVGVSGDLSVSRKKGFVHHDLGAAVTLVAGVYASNESLRVRNALAQAIKGIGAHLAQHAKSWRQHSDLAALIDVALSVALERIELRVLKGELVPDLGNDAAGAPSGNALTPKSDPSVMLAA